MDRSKKFVCVGQDFAAAGEENLWATMLGGRSNKFYRQVGRRTKRYRR